MWLQAALQVERVQRRVAVWSLFGFNLILAVSFIDFIVAQLFFSRKYHPVPAEAGREQSYLKAKEVKAFLLPRYYTEGFRKAKFL